MNESTEKLNKLAEKFFLTALSEIPDEILDPALVTDLALEWAREQAALPVRYQGELCVLMADPLNLEVPKYLSLLFNTELTPLLATREAILSAIEKCYYRGSANAASFLENLSGAEAAPEKIESRADDLLLTAENAPVSRLVNLILLGAVKTGASDVHLEPFEKRLRVRYRIDGVLHDQAAPPKHMEAALVSRLKVMAHMDISEKRLPQDGAARVRVGERELDVRVSTIPVAEGERVVLRLLSRSETLRPMSGLGMTAETLEAFKALLQDTNGIIVVCGPTGSGKTTTLYAALQQLDKLQTNILTIEDPVEYQLPDISQMQVRPKIGLDFAVGLRHILRQDPDTILVGEIRDRETAETAVRASLTGHLVFSTLHTNDAAGAVLRLLDIGVEPYLLAAALRASLAQRLARRLCPDCRQATQLSSEEKKWALAAEVAVPADISLWRAGTGCQACLDGYHGRIGVFELLVIEREMEEIIRSGRCDASVLRSAASHAGMQTLASDGFLKASQGLTSMEELLRSIGRR